MNSSHSFRLSARLVLVCFALLAIVPTAAAQIIQPVIVSNPVPGPQASATAAKPMVWVFTQPKAGGGLETKTVTITDLPKRLVGETAAQAADRKADTLVTEINKVLGAGRAEKFMAKGKPNFKVFGLASGTDAAKKPVVASRLAADPTLQAGNGGTIQQGSGGKMSLGGIMDIDDGTRVATGIGPEGEPSLVQFGIEGLFVASLYPSAGTTAMSILAQLSSELAANGIVNTFDAGEQSLTIEPLYDSDVYSLYWTSTDEGLPFGAGMFAVPEPASWMLLAMGGAALLAFRGRRR
ncbi:MAG: PEP-CTERM sorting domain-containing protein [Planctomycetaceae bacterium]|nr:PEP-CTERM sorting domain-containing protein [Planctomycetaceae bacterium]